MVILNSGQNYVTLTLSELTTIENAEYVMLLVNQSTAKKSAFKLGSDLSDYPERSNKFLITVKDNPEPLDAEVKLADHGQYIYTVYEMVDADSFDFDNI